ncbi:MAG: HAD family hydrolase [Treponema sp.]|nr:HAD family hydrolase [Treponema sp.]
MNENYKLIVFDMDGTILNTLDDLMDATNYGLMKNGFPERTYEEVKWMVGRGMPKLIHSALPENHTDEDFEKVYKDFLDYYGKHSIDKTCAYDGIAEAAKALKAEGYIITVNSNKNDKDAVILAEKYFPGIFDFVLGARPEMEKKPAPDGVNFIAEKFGVEKSKVIFIGDSDVDFLTAQNSEVKFIGCDWGFRGAEFLKNHGAQCIAMKPAELSGIIARM